MSDLLPPNATGAERAMSLATARHAEVPVPVRDLWNPDTCPESLLSWLARALSVDEWDSSWTAEQKRETIKRSVTVHRYKGTIGGVREALGALGFEVRVQEWFNQIPSGDPYTFRILLDVNQVPLDQDALGRIQNVLASAKNLRSHLDSILPSITTRAGPTMAGVLKSGNETCIEYQLSGTALLCEDGTLMSWPDGIYLETE
jgi:phage tail P2-like protein